MIGTIINILKGGWNARKPENSVPGGDGCEHRIIYPFEAICEQAISDIGRVRMLAAECAAERSGDSGAVSSDPIRCEGLALIAAARRTGDFVQVTDVPGTRYTIRTGESEVRIVQPEQVYYKIKDPFAKMHLKRHPVECILLEHVVHNILFPDCRLEFVGVTEDFHKARLVLRQKAVRSESRPDDGQIARALGSLGLKPERRYEFGNEFVFVTDVGQDGDNVLLDDDNAIRFIDPIIGFKQSLVSCFPDVMKSDDSVEDMVEKIYGVHNAAGVSRSQVVSQ